MSREIVILRHAQAETVATDGKDASRRLSPKGHQEARAVRDYFGQHKLAFDRVLCSPASRARETAAEVLGEAALDIDTQIYDATPGTLMSVLDGASASARVLLIGHNPGLEQLIALLVEGRSEDARGLPTAGVARLSVPPERPLEPGIATLKDFWSP